jgi:long-chain acyl-CoA synthetase
MQHVESKTPDPFWAAEFSSVIEMFCEAAAAHPERLFCKSEAVSLSYAQAAGAIQAVADDLGPAARGRDVVLLLPNSPAFLIAYFGALAAGAQPALLNYGHPDATVAKLVEGLDVAATYSDRAIPDLTVTHFEDAALRDAPALRGPVAELAKGAQAEGIGAILFSGGTTGLPKQIRHSHAALVAKIERMEWGWPSQGAEIWLPVAPFTHVYGFLMGVLNPVLRAGSLVIPPRFHPDLIVNMLRDEGVTIFGGGPPAIYQAIMSSALFETARFPELRICPGGGAPFPLDVHRRWEAATGLPITEGYGMTEIAPIAVNTESDGMQPGAAGKPVPDTVIEIVDVQTGETLLPVGQSGEIRVKGPHMMTGYAGNPEESAIALRHGFVYTGDIGMLDEAGFLTISDRKKDVIFVKGFNVFPREIEEALLTHPSVSGACVVRRLDARSGEVPVAYVTQRAEASEAEILAFCAAHLTDYKQPAEIVVLEALPLTAAGKVDRTVLRARAAGEG